MPIIHASREPTHRLPGAQFTALASPSRGSRETSLWTVELAPETPATPHELTKEEVFYVLSGKARVRLGGEEGEAHPGDAIVVPPNTPFELSALGSDPLRAVCCLPVGGEARLADGTTFAPPWSQ